MYAYQELFQRNRCGKSTATKLTGSFEAALQTKNPRHVQDVAGIIGTAGQAEPVKTGLSARFTSYSRLPYMKYQ